MADKLREAINAAEHAQRVLNDPVLTDAWAGVESDIITLWRESSSDDVDGREALYREWHGLKAVKARLERAIAAGKLAEKELEHVKHGN